MTWFVAGFFSIWVTWLLCRVADLKGQVSGLTLRAREAESDRDMWQNTAVALRRDLTAAKKRARAR